MDISYSSGGVTYIDQGGTVTEAHPALSSLDDKFVLGVSRLHIEFFSPTTNWSWLDVEISDGTHKVIREGVPSRNSYYPWGKNVDSVIDTSELTPEADSGGEAGIRLLFYSTGVDYKNLMADTGLIPADICEYVKPSLTAFEVHRSDSSGGTTSDDHAAYTITCNSAAVNAAASDYPSLLANAVETVITFTRNGTDYTNDIDPSGAVLKSGNTPIQLGGQETFMVTATITDGVNTATMSALLSANFAIFNCNAAKDSVAIGKYCDSSFTGFDVNLPSKFRENARFDKTATFNAVPIMIPNMMECVWQKQQPGTSQSAATVTLTRDLTVGEMLFIIWREWENSAAPEGRLHTDICWAGHSVGLMFGATSSTNRNGNRTVSIGPDGTYAANQMRIAACEYNGSTHNEYGVVLALFAFKRGWLNFNRTWYDYVAPT